jgi:hypothetical protein
MLFDERQSISAPFCPAPIGVRLITYPREIGGLESAKNLCLLLRSSMRVCGTQEGGKLWIEVMLHDQGTRRQAPYRERDSLRTSLYSVGVYQALKRQQLDTTQNSSSAQAQYSHDL